MTQIEKMCKNLLSVDNYVRKLTVKGEIITGATIRNRIIKIKSGQMTESEAGFRPHYIAGKYFLEPLSSGK